MNPRLIVAVIALVVAGGTVAVVQQLGGNGSTPTPAATPTLGSFSPLPANCLQLPRRIATPSWYPKDLPLPDGSYAAEEFPESGGTQRATFAVKGDLTAFVRFVLNRWPKEGWVLGRGDAEPGEADDSFRSKDGKRIGAFKARSVYCDKDRTLVLIVLARAAAT